VVKRRQERGRGYDTTIGPDGYPEDPMHPFNRIKTWDK
jgi:hypothetical protein